MMKKNTLFFKFLSGNSFPVLFIIILPLALYYPSLKFDFTGTEDTQLIGVNKPFLEKWSAIPLSFKSNTYFSPYYVEFYRPLQMMTLVIDQHFSTDKKPLVSFHRTQIALYLLSLVLLYGLLLRIRLERLPSFLAVMIFALHPVVTSTVVWLPARGDLLAAVFALLTVHTFISLQKGKKLFFPLHFICLFGALFSKETAIVLPLVLLSFDKFFLKNRLLTWKNAFLVICWLGSVLVYLLMKSLGLMYDNTEAILTGWPAFVKSLPLLPIALSKMILPFDMTTYAIFKPVVVISGILLIVAVSLLISKDKNSRQMYIFGLLWFVIFLVPVMMVRFSLVEYGREYNECWMFLPGIGLIMMLGTALQNLKRKRNFTWFVVLCTAVIVTFGFAASAHVKDFTNIASFSNSALRSYPDNAFAFVDRGQWKFGEGNFEGGIQDVSRSINICSKNDYAFYIRATFYFYTRRYEEARRDLIRATTLNPFYVEAYIYKGWVDFSEKRYKDAIEDFNMVVKIRPDHGWGHYLRGKSYEELGDYENALDDYSIAAFMTDGDSRMVADARRMKEIVHKMKAREESDAGTP
jgi:hypothetical protein